MRTHHPGKAPATGEPRRTADRTAMRLHAKVRRSAVDHVLDGPGQPLAAPLKEEMQARLGWDFSGVPVHTDSAVRASSARHALSGPAPEHPAHPVHPPPAAVASGAALQRMPADEPARPLTSVSAPEPALPFRQAGPGRAAGVGHSFAQIPVFSSAPDDARAHVEPSLGRFEPARGRENNTGLPETLQARVEALSGMALDDVRVHYDSSSPARLRAWAYTKGTRIYLGPGQERHLAHEAWHVVQQKQGRVKPTAQANDVAINDDHELEREADAKGKQAEQPGSINWRKNAASAADTIGSNPSLAPIQAMKAAEPEPEDEITPENRPLATEELSAGPKKWRRTVGGNPDEAKREVTLPNVAVRSSTQSLRSPAARMLDRTARAMMQQEGGTPHIALTMIGDQLHMAGNTGWSEAQARAALERLRQYPDLDINSIENARVSKDIRKFRALRAGDYSKNHPRIDNLEDEEQQVAERKRLETIQGAILTPNLITVVPNEGAGREKIHGEMQLLNSAKEYMEANRKPLGDDSAAKEPFPVGGFKRDCLACHWSFALFNQHIAGPLGYEVRSGGTHGGLYPNWKKPAWMTDTEGASNDMEDLVARQAAGWSFENHLLKKAKKANDAVPAGVGHLNGESDNPEESDSDYEEE